MVDRITWIATRYSWDVWILEGFHYPSINQSFVPVRPVWYSKISCCEFYSTIWALVGKQGVGVQTATWNLLVTLACQGADFPPYHSWRCKWIQWWYERSTCEPSVTTENHCCIGLSCQSHQPSRISSFASLRFQTVHLAECRFHLYRAMDWPREMSHWCSVTFTAIPPFIV